MRVEWYAALVALVGVSLWLSGRVFDSVIAMLVFTVFGGGAAFIVGGASITPASFAIVFLLAHLLLSMFRKTDHVNIGLKTNGYLAFYCLYGAATAYILPKIFLGLVAGPPVSVRAVSAFSAVPLQYSKQNITAAIYLIGVLITSICAGAASTDPKSRRAVVRWGVIIAWLHIGFGLAGSALQHVGGAAIVKFFRNATYAEVVESEQGYFRIDGIFPEPSAFAGYAFIWLVFTTELWLRNVRPRLTGLTAVALTMILVACTSTSGYASMALYALILLGRFALAPRRFPLAKAIPIALLLLTAATAGLATCAFNPHLSATIGRIVAKLTVGKADTTSGRQRLFVIRASIRAVGATWGIGVGPGSFRSSSLLLAILESTGVIGLVTFFAHVFKILKPWRGDTYALPGDPADAVAAATSWTACAGLIPALLIAPTAVPSYVFAILGGLTLGWRVAPQRQRSLARASGRIVHSYDPRQGAV